MTGMGPGCVKTRMQSYIKKYLKRFEALRELLFLNERVVRLKISFRCGARMSFHTASGTRSLRKFRAERPLSDQLADHSGTFGGDDSAPIPEVGLDQGE